MLSVLDNASAERGSNRRKSWEASSGNGMALGVMGFESTAFCMPEMVLTTPLARLRNARCCNILNSSR